MPSYIVFCLAPITTYVLYVGAWLFNLPFARLLVYLLIPYFFAHKANYSVMLGDVAVVVPQSIGT
jgi:hypothetical protein